MYFIIIIIIIIVISIYIYFNSRRIVSNKMTMTSPGFPDDRMATFMGDYCTLVG
jgi:hypothetical protein